MGRRLVMRPYDSVSMFRLEIWLVIFEFPFAETTKPLCYFLPCLAGTLRTVSIYETAEALVNHIQRQSNNADLLLDRSGFDSVLATPVYRRERRMILRPLRLAARPSPEEENRTCPGWGPRKRGRRYLDCEVFLVQHAFYLISKCRLSTGNQDVSRISS
jgi:hypothetical protein